MAEVAPLTPVEEAELHMAIELGSLTIAWTQYEMMLFGIFWRLLKTSLNRAGIVWFSLVSFDLRLRLMTDLVKADRRSNEQELLDAIKEAKALSLRRNTFVHWTWVVKEGNHAIFDLRKPPSADTRARLVSDDEVRRLFRDVTKHRLKLDDVLTAMKR